MLPGDGITAGIGKDKTCFTTDAQYRFAYKDHGEPLNTTEIKEYIMNPHKFNLNVEMDDRYLNLWSTDNERTDGNDEVVIKSVYDPSPVGYSLPAYNAFTGFTTTGQNVSNWPNPLTPEERAQFNVKGDLDKGLYFYTKPNKQGITFFFPASGFRYYNSGLLGNVSTNGFDWVAGPYDRSHGRYLGFGSDNVVPLLGTHRSYGLAVRSAEEKKLKYGLEVVARYWVLSLHSQSFSQQNNKHLQQAPFRR